MGARAEGFDGNVVVGNFPSVEQCMHACVRACYAQVSYSIYVCYVCMYVCMLEER